MTAGQAIPFLLFSIVAAITPGPSNLILTSTGAAVGVRRGLACLFGVGAGMGVMMFVVAFGLGSLVLENPLVLQMLKWCGIGFLLWLARKIARSGPSETTNANVFVGFWPALAFQWVNPKSWLVCAGAVGTYLQTGAGSAFQQSLSIGLLFMLVALPCCFVWLAFGATVQRILRTERAWRMFNLGMGALLAASIFLFIW